MSAFKSTMMHVLELMAILAVTLGVQKTFDVSSEAVLAVVTVVLSGLAKLARSSDSIPVADYVNRDD